MGIYNVTSGIFRRVILSYAAFITSTALLATKQSPKQSYNYSDGFVGSNTSGVNLSEAGDIDESQLPLETPRIKKIELHHIKDIEKSADRSNK
ncbi:MAG: hypothetical protein A2Z20_05525 [Bdellovibrionales bacterium RBG_16_40_8]|nr:MAG: hypothetical protein A2Z20_05525 [Bdellovibrionales bacterium RBG_16_40_8]